MIVIKKREYTGYFTDNFRENAVYFTDNFDDLFSLKNEESPATILVANLFHQGIKRKTIKFYKSKGLKEEEDILAFRDLMMAIKERIISLDKIFTNHRELRKVERSLQGIFFSKKIFQYLVENPQEVDDFSKFIYHYLPNLNLLLESYMAFDLQNNKDSKVRAGMADTLSLIKNIQDCIQDDYHEIFLDNVKLLKDEIHQTDSK
jgi:5-bromo-4-chloroindolyl phosphate hydrolysis protein